MTTSTKSYTAKSSAIRAAKKDFTTEYAAGLVTVSQNDDGKWVYQVEAAEPAKKASNNDDLFDTEAMEKANAVAKKSQADWVAKMSAPAKDYMTEAKKEGANVLTGVDNQPSDKVLKKAIAKKKAPKPTKDTTGAWTFDNIATTRAEQLGIDGLENLDQDIKEGNFSRVSEIESPCAKVWAIAEAMQGARRKDIIAACVDHGVAYNTARTQYQHWFTAQKNDAAARARNEAKKATK